MARGQAWLTVDIARSALRERGIAATKLTQQAQVFGSHYSLVLDAADRDTNTYQAMSPMSFSTRGAALPMVRTMSARGSTTR